VAIPDHVLSTGVNVWRNNQLSFTGMNPSLAAPTVEWTAPSRIWTDDANPNVANLSSIYSPQSGLIFKDKVYWFDRVGGRGYAAGGYPPWKRGWLRCHDLATGAEDWATDLRYRIDQNEEPTSGPWPYNVGSGSGYFGFDEVYVDCVTDGLVVMKTYGTLVDAAGWTEQEPTPAPNARYWNRYQGRVWAFNRSNGTLAWESPNINFEFPQDTYRAPSEEKLTNSSYWQSPIVVPGGDLIYAHVGGCFRLDATDGSMVWKKTAIVGNNEAGWIYGAGRCVGPTLMRTETEFMLISDAWYRAPGQFGGDPGQIARLYSVATGQWISQMDNPTHKWGTIGDGINVAAEWACPPMAHSAGHILFPATSWYNQATLYEGANQFPGGFPTEPDFVACHAAAADLNLTWKNRLLMSHGPTGWAEGAGGHIYGLSNVFSRAAPGNYGEPIALDIVDGTEQHRRTTTEWVTDPTGLMTPPFYWIHISAHIVADDIGNVFYLTYPCGNETTGFDSTAGLYVQETFLRPWNKVVPKLKAFSSTLNLGWEMDLRPSAYDDPWHDETQSTFEFGINPYSPYGSFDWPPSFGSHSVSGAKYMVWHNGYEMVCYKQGGTGPVAPPKRELQYVDGAGWIPVP